MDEEKEKHIEMEEKKVEMVWVELRRRDGERREEKEVKQPKVKERER